MRTLFFLLAVLLTACGSAPEAPQAQACKAFNSYWAFNGGGLDMTPAKLGADVQTYGYVGSVGCWYDINVQGTEAQGAITISVQRRETTYACRDMTGTFDYTKTCTGAKICARYNGQCFEVK